MADLVDAVLHPDWAGCAPQVRATDLELAIAAELGVLKVLEVLGYLAIASGRAAEIGRRQGADPFPSAQTQTAVAPCRRCILYKS